MESTYSDKAQLEHRAEGHKLKRVSHPSSQNDVYAGTMDQCYGFIISEGWTLKDRAGTWFVTTKAKGFRFALWTTDRTVSIDTFLDSEGREVGQLIRMGKKYFVSVK